MKCSNPNCNRGIGLVRYRRGWFSKQRYCSRNCCDAFAADVPKQQQRRSVTSYFEWLFSQPIGNSQQKLILGIIRIKMRGHGFRATKPGELHSAISKAFAVDGPVVVDCVVAADELPNFPHIELGQAEHYAAAKIKEAILAVTVR